MRKMMRLALGGLGVTAIALLAPRGYTALKYQQHIYSAAAAPSEKAAIVFGAGLWRDGRPTPVLYDRVAAAAELYQAGKIEKLLLSGDNRFMNYNEPAAMRQVALDLGVPDDALVLDYAGRSTYDTCYRAKAIFGVERALLVTQNFHLPRALFLCEVLGIGAVGVSADRRDYRRGWVAYWNFREIFATANAWWEVNVARPEPVLGERLPIH